MPTATAREGQGNDGQNNGFLLRSLIAQCSLNNPPASSGSLIYRIIYELQPVRPIDIYDWTSHFLKETAVLVVFILTSFKDIMVYIYSYMIKVKWKTYAFITAYLALLILAIKYDVLSTFVIISIFTLIFTNLQKRLDGELSAYSVFNEGFIRLLGTTTAEDIDNNIRNNRA